MKSYLPLLFAFFVLLSACSEVDNKKNETSDETSSDDAIVQTTPPCQNEVPNAEAIQWIQALQGPYTNFSGVKIPKEMICDDQGTTKELCFVFDYVGQGESAHYQLYLINVTLQNDEYLYVCEPLYRRNLLEPEWTKETTDCTISKAKIDNANVNWSAHVANGPKSFIVPADDIICINQKLGNDCTSNATWKDLYIHLGSNNGSVKLLISDVKELQNVTESTLFADMCLPCPDICGRFE